MGTGPRCVAFLCVQNSARSQMAEGLARAMAPAGVDVHSAGSAPLHVRPQAVRALAAIGIDSTGQRAKSTDELPLAELDTIVTLCAEEVCPVVPGSAARRLHWPIPDPAAAIGADTNDAAVHAAFCAARDEIRARLETEFGWKLS